MCGPTRCNVAGRSSWVGSRRPLFVLLADANAHINHRLEVAQCQFQQFTEGENVMTLGYKDQKGEFRYVNQAAVDGWLAEISRLRTALEMIVHDGQRPGCLAVRCADTARVALGHQQLKKEG